MNFTTDLPKRNPLVCYIVASAVRCEKFFQDSNKPGPIYRMHAVILKGEGIKQAAQGRKHLDLYICCHIRRVEDEADGPEEQPTVQPDHMINYLPYVLPRPTETPKLSGIKRPRRQAAVGKNYAEEDEDPYIYTSGVVLRGNQRRRKAEEEASRLGSVSPSYSAKQSFIGNDKVPELGAFTYSVNGRFEDETGF